MALVTIIYVAHIFLLEIISRLFYNSGSALLFRTEYDRANSRIAPKEYGFDNSRSIPLTDRYAVENGQSELAFGLLANPMLFKNNLSYISVGMEMQDGVPDYVLSLNDVLMATYFGDRIMWSGKG